MSRSRTWSARLLPLLGVGGLCLLLTACAQQKAPEGAAKRADAGAAPMGPPGGPNALPAPQQSPEAGGPAKKNQDYAAIVENPFQWVKTAPVSTFSADVNTASYSDIRRHLNDNKLPPRDAVLL